MHPHFSIIQDDVSVVDIRDLKGYHLTIPSSVQNAPSVLIKRVVKKKSTTKSLICSKLFFESLVLSYPVHNNRIKLTQ